MSRIITILTFLILTNNLYSFESVFYKKFKDAITKKDDRKEEIKAYNLGVTFLKDYPDSKYINEIKEILSTLKTPINTAAAVTDKEYQHLKSLYIRYCQLGSLHYQNSFIKDCAKHDSCLTDYKKYAKPCINMSAMNNMDTKEKHIKQIMSDDPEIRHCLTRAKGLYNGAVAEFFDHKRRFPNKQQKNTFLSTSQIYMKQDIGSFLANKTLFPKEKYDCKSVKLTNK